VNTYGDLAFRLVFDGEQAADDTASGGENERLVIDVLANDAEGLSLNTASAPAGKGSVSIVDGKLVFDPGTAFDRLAAGQTETVTLTYTARRNDEAPHSAEVTVTVTGANDRPFLASSLPDHTVLAGSQLNIIVSQGRFIDPDQGDR
jgi:VCBS repeat-containing protein